MKFGMLYTNDRYKNNIGEGMLPLALRYVYKQMGIEEKDTICISQDELSTYSGAYLLLPICSWISELFRMEKTLSKCFSERIVPVFTNFFLANDLFSEAIYTTEKDREIAWLKSYEPIGCRDEFTMVMLRRYGINAYLSGCITIVLPRCDINQISKRKVFLVDIDSDLEKHIPESLMQDAVRFSHDFPPNLENPLEEIQNVYNLYQNEARLMVTSRLHAAIPCMAAGIPVIFAKNEFSTRFTFIDRLLPVYDSSQYTEIDWNPPVVEYERHKEIVLQHIIARIRGAVDFYSPMYDISEYYEQREKRDASLDCNMEQFKAFVGSKWSNSEEFNYSIWGIGQLITHALYAHMTCHYPNARLLHVYDKNFHGVDFHGITIEMPEFIKNRNREFLFVCAGKSSTAREMVFYLESIGVDLVDYFVFQRNYL